MRILVLNGPNLNMLGRREPEIYGAMTLDALNRSLGAWVEQEYNSARGPADAIDIAFYQSNHEGQLIDCIQNSPRLYDGVVYNPGGHTHYSISLRDAIASVPVPFVEAHLSDIAAREDFRAVSVIKDVCIAQFKGEGETSYQKAIACLIAHIEGRHDA
jgi:3-dehydroquinate dehydratase-2